MRTKSLVILLLLCASSLFAQAVIIPDGGTVQGAHRWVMKRVYQKTNFVNSGADTTGFINVEPNADIAFILRATDSAATDVNFDARNGVFPNSLQYTNYADSLKLADSTAGFVATNTNGLVRNVLIKTTTLNRLNSPANSQVRIRVVHRSSGAGTTAGRVFEVWMVSKN